MSQEKVAAECSSEKSLQDDVEKEIVGAAATDVSQVEEERARPKPQASGDRALVLMDLENGLVGWENSEDPENPQYVPRVELKQRR